MNTKSTTPLREAAEAAREKANASSEAALAAERAAIKAYDDYQATKATNPDDWKGTKAARRAADAARAAAQAAKRLAWADGQTFWDALDDLHTLPTLDASHEGHSLSHATFRDEDLLDAFVEFLLGLEHPAINAKLETYFGIPLALIAQIGWETFVEENDPEDTSWLINEDLFNLLNLIAPEGCFFGSHPGDYSDFGFWANEDYD